MHCKSKIPLVKIKDYIMDLFPSLLIYVEL